MLTKFGVRVSALGSQALILERRAAPRLKHTCIRWSSGDEAPLGSCPSSADAWPVSPSHIRVCGWKTVLTQATAFSCTTAHHRLDRKCVHARSS